MNSLLTFLLKGGWVVWPLFVLSIAALGIAIDRGWAIFRSTWNNRTLQEQLEEIDSKQELSTIREILDERSGPLSNAVRTFLRYAPDKAWQHKVSHVSSREIERLEHRLDWLPVIANVATLTGLFGTVLGMVKVFQTIETQGGTPNPSQLAGGIWEALLTTLIGLGIAIPTILVYNLLHGRLDRLSSRIKECVEDLHDQYETGEEQVA